MLRSSFKQRDSKSSEKKTSQLPMYNPVLAAQAPLNIMFSIHNRRSVQRSLFDEKLIEFAYKFGSPKLALKDWQHVGFVLHPDLDMNLLEEKVYIENRRVFDKYPDHYWTRLQSCIVALQQRRLVRFTADDSEFMPNFVNYLNKAEKDNYFYSLSEGKSGANPEDFMNDVFKPGFYPVTYLQLALKDAIIRARKNNISYINLVPILMSKKALQALPHALFPNIPKPGDIFILSMLQAMIQNDLLILKIPKFNSSLEMIFYLMCYHASIYQHRKIFEIPKAGQVMREDMYIFKNQRSWTPLMLCWSMVDFLVKCEKRNLKDLLFKGDSKDLLFFMLIAIAKVHICFWALRHLRLTSYYGLAQLDQADFNSRLLASVILLISLTNYVIQNSITLTPLDKHFDIGKFSLFCHAMLLLMELPSMALASYQSAITLLSLSDHRNRSLVSTLPFIVRSEESRNNRYAQHITRVMAGMAAAIWTWHHTENPFYAMLAGIACLNELSMIDALTTIRNPYRLFQRRHVRQLEQIRIVRNDEQVADVVALRHRH